MTITQRQIHVNLTEKSRLSTLKAFPLTIKTVGDLIMIARKKAGLTRHQLSKTTNFSTTWISRWELDRSIPSHDEWNTLMNVLKLPISPIKIFTKMGVNGVPNLTLGELLKNRRKKLNISQPDAASKIGVSKVALSLWERDKIFPTYQHHAKISAFLDQNLFDELLKHINIKS